MAADDPPPRSAELAQLRRLGRAALTHYGIREASLRLLRHEQNTTFKVTATGARHVLRVSRPRVQTPATIESEMDWLGALGRETDLGVPIPVLADSGTYVIVARDPWVPEPRPCVVLEWLDGRFVDARLTPAHLSRVGRLMGTLQVHAQAWARPAGFLRPRVDTLTETGRRASISDSAMSGTGDEYPTTADGGRAVGMVRELLDSEASTLVARALEVARATTRSLAATPGAQGLIHGDLHQENFLFHEGAARAIDFDDCGWGFHLYDVAVPVSELETRPTFPRLRDGLLEAYSAIRPLPAGFEDHLKALVILRRLQIIAWILDSRQHGAFRDDWQAWSRKELAGLGDALRALP